MREVERPPGRRSRDQPLAWSVHSEVHRGEAGASRTQTKGVPAGVGPGGWSLPGACKSEVPLRCARDGEKPETRTRAPTSSQPARGAPGVRARDQGSRLVREAIADGPDRPAQGRLKRGPPTGAPRPRQPSSPPPNLQPTRFNGPRGVRPSCRSPLLPHSAAGSSAPGERRRGSGRRRDTLPPWRASLPASARGRRQVRSSTRGLDRRNPEIAFPSSPRGAQGRGPCARSGTRESCWKPIRARADTHPPPRTPPAPAHTPAPRTHS